MFGLIQLTGIWNLLRHHDKSTANSEALYTGSFGSSLYLSRFIFVLIATNLSIFWKKYLTGYICK